MSGEIKSISLDYHDSKRLNDVIRDQIALYGPISQCIVWAHSSAKEVPGDLAKIIGESNIFCEYYHILGSNAKSPNNDSDKLREYLESFFAGSYHQVVLGFKKEGMHSRWLTDQEISGGVVEAINCKENLFIVGQVEPWEERP